MSAVPEESACATPGLELPAADERPGVGAIEPSTIEDAYAKHLRQLRDELIKALPSDDWGDIIKSVVKIGKNDDSEKAYTPADVIGAAKFLQSLQTGELDETGEGAAAPVRINEEVRDARRIAALEAITYVVERAVAKGVEMKPRSVHGVESELVERPTQ